MVFKNWFLCKKKKSVFLKKILHTSGQFDFSFVGFKFFYSELWKFGFFNANDWLITPIHDYIRDRVSVWKIQKGKKYQLMNCHMYQLKFWQYEQKKCSFFFWWLFLFLESMTIDEWEKKELLRDFLAMEKLLYWLAHNYRFLFFQSNNWTPLHHQMVIIYMPKTKKIFIENYSWME